MKRSHLVVRILSVCLIVSGLAVTAIGVVKHEQALRYIQPVVYSTESESIDMPEDGIYIANDTGISAATSDSEKSTELETDVESESESDDETEKMTTDETSDVDVKSESKQTAEEES